jgi:hypothetical protein
MIELTSSEEALLRYHAAVLDMNLANLAQAQQGVKVGTEMFDNAWRIVVRAHGLDPDLYRATWDGRQIKIEPVEEVT